MKTSRKILAFLMVFTLVFGLFGCTAKQDNETTDTTKAVESDSAAAADEEKSSQASAEEPAEKAAVRVGSLTGPTSIGLVYLMDQMEKGQAKGEYDFTMETAADVLLAAMIKGDLDIALIPANVASVLYQKTEGQVAVIDINTLGVLYVVASDTSIQTVADLKGRTLYLTGKGQTPEYVLRYLLEENGLAEGEVTLEFKSEATEVVSALAADSEAIGLLPQPFATAACVQNENFQAVLDLSAEWDAVQGEGGSRLVTGVTVVRREFLEENEEAVQTFLKEHEASAAYANEHTEEAAELVAAAGIIEKAAIAAKAMPYCSITYLDGEEMKSALEGYLTVLADKDEAFVGGALPGEDFYYSAE